MKRYTEVTIVGGGPAGIAAAIELHRLGFKPLLIERDRLGGQLRAARHILDYPGFSHGIKGVVLAERMAAQVQSLGVEVIEDDVVSIQSCDKDFDVSLKNTALKSRCVIVAIGQRPKSPGLPFETKLNSSRVWHYPVPDDVPHKDKDILIIGGGDAAFDEALSFADGGARTVLAMRGDNPKAMPQLVKMAEQENIQIIKRAKISAIKFDGNRFQYDDMRFDHVVVCVGKTPDLTIMNELDDNVDGVFLAGDCARGLDRHVALAVGDGVAAAYKAKAWITGEA